jgi:hypothetical protein
MNGTSEQKSPQKIAFLFDERLSHDRKLNFARSISLLKAHFFIDFLPSAITEQELVTHLEENKYALVLLPWYKYISWKKIETHFGALRLQGSTVAGYFAEAVLPMDLSAVPPFHRFLFLDFYRFDQTELEMILSILTHHEQATGFNGVSVRNTQLYHAEWFDQDQHSTACVDAILKIPLIAGGSWANRAIPLRFFLTSLWSLCFAARRSFPSADAVANVEIIEVKKRLLIKIVFENSELTLSKMLVDLWPTGEHSNHNVNEMVRYADFVRVHHFPESHHLEITAMFTPSAPSLHHMPEVRGFWIEPLKKRYLNTSGSLDLKRIPISPNHYNLTSESLQRVIEQMRGIVSHMHPKQALNKATLDSQMANLRYLVEEVERRIPASTEKRVEKRAEKKKVA